MPPITGYEDLGDYYENPWQPRDPRPPGQQPPETGGGNGPPLLLQGYGTKQSADQRIASGLTPEQQRMLESLQAQFQTAAGGYYNPRIGVALARGLQNGRSPEAIMQLVNQYISENGGGGQGYDRDYTAFAQSHDGGQSLLNQLALESWGGANPYAYDPRFEPTGGTRPPRPGPPPTGGGETRGGGLGEPGGGGGSGSGGYGYGGPGDPRGDRNPIPEGGIDPPGRTPDPKPGQGGGGGGGPRGERIMASPQGGYASAYQAQPQAQAQQQPRTVTVRYDYGGGTQSAGAAKPQAYGAQAQPQRQQQQAPQPTAYGTDRSNMGIQPSMQRTQSTAPTQPRYTAPMAQQAQNRQGPQGYAQGYNGAQGPRNWFGR